MGELYMIKTKLRRVRHIVNQNILAIHTKYRLCPRMVGLIISHMKHEINKWKGMRSTTNTNKKNQFSDFRNYFAWSMKNWSMKKVRVFGDIFWKRIFDHFGQFVRERTANPRIRQLNTMKILRDLLSAKIKYTHCVKLQSLMHDSDITYSEQMQKYLFKLHSSLAQEGNTKSRHVLATIVSTLGALIDEWYQNVRPPIGCNVPNTLTIPYGGYHTGR